mmetsp:Transcript_41291/g.133021  ORF Transcript_41291/g.133021 Transcript_41291/m.133021 type:complete len:390 (+) Transcript_41291:367-1536(+)
MKVHRMCPRQRLAHHCQRVLLGIPCVHDQRQAERGRQPRLPGEDGDHAFSLLRKFGVVEVLVIIQAALAPCNHLVAASLKCGQQPLLVAVVVLAVVVWVATKGTIHRSLEQPLGRQEQQAGILDGLHLAAIRDHAPQLRPLPASSLLNVGQRRQWNGLPTLLIASARHKRLAAAADLPGRQRRRPVPHREGLEVRGLERGSSRQLRFPMRVVALVAVWAIAVVLPVATELLLVQPLQAILLVQENIVEVAMSIAILQGARVGIVEIVQRVRAGYPRPTNRIPVPIRASTTSESLAILSTIRKGQAADINRGTSPLMAPIARAQGAAPPLALGRVLIFALLTALPPLRVTTCEDPSGIAPVRVVPLLPPRPAMRTEEVAIGSLPTFGRGR